MKNKGLQRSLLLHGIVLVVAMFGLPSLFKKAPEPVTIVMAELVPIASKTNVPKAEKPEPPKEEEPKKEPKFEKKTPPPPPPPPAPPEKPEPAPEPEKKPEPEKAEPRPEAKKKPVPKPKAQPKKTEEKPKKKEEKLDFESVLKTVEKIEKKQAQEEKKKTKTDNSSAKAKNSALFDPAQNLSVSERDAIIQQISQCWSIPAGAKDAQDLSVLLHLSLDKDGTVRDVEIVDTVRYSSGDTFYRAAADSAVRAVLKCSPLKGLPVSKYDNWKEIEMNFDPKEMLY